MAPGLEEQPLTVIQRRQWTGTSLYFGDHGVLSSRDRRRRLVSLTSGPVESHDPVVSLLLVLGGEQDRVALLDRVEEVLPAFQI